MATGTEISLVICAAALVTPRPPFSQYNRADEVALFVSQYSVKSSSTSSFRRGLLGIAAVRPQRETWVHEHEPREAGGGVREAVPDGLRARGQHRHVSRVPFLGVSA